MKKRLISILLVCAALFSLGVTALAAEDAPVPGAETEAAGAPEDIPAADTAETVETASAGEVPETGVSEADEPETGVPEADEPETGVSETDEPEAETENGSEEPCSEPEPEVLPEETGEDETIVQDGEALAVSEAAVNAVVSGDAGQNVSYSYENGVLTLTFIGGAGDSGDTYSCLVAEKPWLFMYTDENYFTDEDIVSLVIGEGVTSVGGSLFSGCDNLRSVTFPSTMKKVDQHAFKGCVSLTSVASAPGLDWSKVEIADGNSMLKQALGLSSDGEGTYTSSMGEVYWKIEGTKLTFSAVSGSSFSAIDRGFSYGEDKDILTINESGWRSAADIITEIVIGEGITAADSSFSGFVSLKKVTLPSTLTSIGSSTFYGCDALETVVYNGTANPWNVISIEDRNEPFIKALNEIVPASPSGTFGDNDAFSWKLENGTLTISGTGDMPYGAPWSTYLPLVKELVVQSGVTSVAGGICSGAEALTSVILPATVTLVGSHAFSDCAALEAISIPAGVTDIGFGAFSGCAALKNVTLPSAVTGIGAYAFSGCAALTAISIPVSARSIGNYAFSESGLTSASYGGTEAQWRQIDIGYGNKLLWDLLGFTVSASGDFDPLHWKLEGTTLTIWGQGEMPFTQLEYTPKQEKGDPYPWGSYGDIVEQIVIENGVTSIGSEAFGGFHALKSVSLPNSLTTISYSALSNTGLESVELPDSVTDIGEQAFLGSSYLTGVKLPRGLTTISDSTFSMCPKLKTVEIPDGVTEIEQLAFYECRGLESVILPTSLQTIGYFAFSDCAALKNVFYKGTQAQWDKVAVNTNGNVRLRLATLQMEYTGSEKAAVIVDDQTERILSGITVTEEDLAKVKDGTLTLSNGSTATVDTEKLQKALETGAVVTSQAVVTPKTEADLTETEAASLREVTGEDEAVFLVDLSIAIMADGETVGSIVQTSEAMTFSIQISDEEAAALAGKTVYVVRIHDGVAEKLETEMEGNTLTFTTDKFSTYAVYAEAGTGNADNTDTSGNTNNTNTNTNTNSAGNAGGSPRTGDGAAPVLWAVLFLACAMGLGLMTAARRKAGK